MQIAPSCSYWLLRCLDVCPNSPSNVPGVTEEVRHSSCGSLASRYCDADFLAKRKAIQEHNFLAARQPRFSMGDVLSTSTEPGQSGRDCSQGAAQTRGR